MVVQICQEQNFVIIVAGFLQARYPYSSHQKHIIKAATETLSTHSKQ